MERSPNKDRMLWGKKVAGYWCKGRYCCRIAINYNRAADRREWLKDLEAELLDLEDQQ